MLGCHGCTIFLLEVYFLLFIKTNLLPATVYRLLEVGNIVASISKIIK